MKPWLLPLRRADGTSAHSRYVLQVFLNLHLTKSASSYDVLEVRVTASCVLYKPASVQLKGMYPISHALLLLHALLVTAFRTRTSGATYLGETGQGRLKSARLTYGI